MKQSRLYFVLFLLQICCLLPAAAPAQLKHNVLRWHAFRQEQVAGNVEVDEHGEQGSGVTVQHVLYVQTRGKWVPSFNVVYTNAGVFAVQPREITAASHQVGETSAGKVTVITRSKGARLWQLELIPMKAAVPAAIQRSLVQNAMVVITEWKGVAIQHTIPRQVQLATVFYK